MKRDLDLARQLLLDIENRGADCSVSVLRTGSSQDCEEGIRYHLRLLIDAGLLKEIDRTSAGIPCVRLTHDGHEFLEICRSDSRWREAKLICQERTGGLSLKVIQGLLTRWAWRSVARVPRRRRPYLAPNPRLEAEIYFDESVYQDDRTYRVEPYGFDDRETWDREAWDEDSSRYVRVRPETRERMGRSGIDLNGDGTMDAEFASRLPGYIL